MLDMTVEFVETQSTSSASPFFQEAG